MLSAGLLPILGHWIMEEQPDATVKMIRDFLGRK
jgi:hypothetical protein